MAISYAKLTSEKKKDLSKLLRKAPDVKDLELWSRFTKFNAKDNFFNRRNGANNKNNNNNFLPPPSPPLPSARNFSPLSYLPPPPHPPTLSDFFWDDPGENLSQQSPYIAPDPDPPPLPLTSNLRPKQQRPMATNTNQTLSGDRLIGELERVIEKEKPKENIVLDDDIVFPLPKIPTILDNDDFKVKKQTTEQMNKEIGDEINIHKIQDEINSGNVPSENEFYFGGPSRTFS